MNITITGRHVQITPSLEEYVNEKMSKLTHYFSNITSAHVTLTVEKLEHSAAAQVNMARAEIHASATEGDMYAAIDGLMPLLIRQVTKHKEKMQDRSVGHDEMQDIGE